MNKHEKRTDKISTKHQDKQWKLDDTENSLLSLPIYTIIQHLVVSTLWYEKRLKHYIFRSQNFVNDTKPFLNFLFSLCCDAN